MVNIYNFIMDLFISISNKFVNNIIPNLASLFRLTELLNFIGITLIVIYCVKKIQEGDFLNWKNLAQLIVFLLYLGFFNWVAKNPSTYINYFSTLVEYPANAIIKAITNATQDLQQNVSGNYKGGVDWLIQKSYEAGTQVMERAIPRFSFAIIPTTHYLRLIAIQ
ncbi:hypothetical protein [Helicobacter fennelliae]|uniref:hypothetical protein n=1 Tax=Helicobacter fennelliae TaxID=215 RepID=UPI000E04A959|nr:hypothetical protein [Helicobacter fennelliae]STQ84440.1 membrane protein [Helicobacter fennelliae]